MLLAVFQHTVESEHSWRHEAMGFKKVKVLRHSAVYSQI